MIKHVDKEQFKFINEDIGREVAININKLNIDSLINLINKWADHMLKQDVFSAGKI